jgi:hypothetical protein
MYLTASLHFSPNGVDDKPAPRMSTGGPIAPVAAAAGTAAAPVGAPAADATSTPRQDLSRRDPEVDSLSVDEEYLKALLTGQALVPCRVRALGVSADSAMLSADLVVRIVMLCQPLRLYLSRDCPLPAARPEQVLSVVALHLYGRDEAAGALLHRWFPLTESVTVDLSTSGLHGFLTLPPGPALRTVELCTESR